MIGTAQAQRAAVLLIALAAGAIGVTAERASPFEATVVAVHDGDTISVREGGRTTRVRLVGIDCPEARQPFAARAKQLTSELLFGRIARIEPHGLDRYDRLLARVVVSGRDVNEALVRAGLAWYYPFGDANLTLESAERTARATRAGLWSDPRPVPPWVWRHGAPRSAARGVRN